MFDRLKMVLVESFIGVIALGYLFAEAILYFVNIFTTSLAVLVGRITPPPFSPGGREPLEVVLRPVTSFLVLLLVWYVLLRWLYFTPPKRATSDPTPSPNQAE
jgi:hypothetical protein